ncbi:unnamed protein product [Polarella glacialis]|uniref:Uncharacterized protein n=1 Tax=Polarella glacialis TaxID=89957 RepID=A0A813IBH3_POLGL|nr:unnamed protein product [Polarella glacialis]
MTAPQTSRVAAASLLLGGVAWAQTAFVPAAGRVGQVQSPPQLRGAAGAAAVGAEGSAEVLGATGLLPVGLAAATLAVAGTGAGRRRQLATQRRFFAGGPAPTPATATSYKDYNDPFLGSADLGFDPLNLAVSGGTFDKAASAVPETTYYNYRESEVKHGRFAMVAFLAIFAESADRSAVLHQLGQVKLEDKLDGTLGLDEVQLPVLLVGLGIQALAEYNLQSSEKDDNFLSVEYKKDRMPGDLGFDPLGLGKGSGADKKGLHNIEINTGRLAMIGVTTFLFKEFIVKDAVLASKIL